MRRRESILHDCTTARPHEFLLVGARDRAATVSVGSPLQINHKTDRCLPDDISRIGYHAHVRGHGRSPQRRPVFWRPRWR